MAPLFLEKLGRTYPGIVLRGEKIRVGMKAYADDSKVFLYDMSTVDTICRIMPNDRG